MYSESDLEAAVAAGALSPEAARQLRDFVAGQKALPAADVIDQPHIESLARNLTPASAGQLLFGLAAACRRAGIDPEMALRQECDRVMRDVETRVQSRN